MSLPGRTAVPAGSAGRDGPFSALVMRWRGARRVAGLVAIASGLGWAGTASASNSVFRGAPSDPAAVAVRGVGDGRADDTAALQGAIDAAAGAHGEGGVVFVPSGRYRISRTVFVWPGVRVFGVGPTRPVIALGRRTPGFQTGVATMVIFAGARPGQMRRVPFPPPDSRPFRPDVADANPGTFYSGMSNVDFAIEAGNTGAAAIRFHAAQHAVLKHMDFFLGTALTGLYQVGNEAEDLHFHGGRYGVLTEKPSPAWQFALIDSSFDGQREAAIREHEAGLTLVDVAIRDTPVGLEIDRGYGDWLWGKDVHFERVSRAGIVISNELNAYTQIGFDHAVAADTPVFARFRDSGRTLPGQGRVYEVKSFSHGLHVPAMGRTGRTGTRFEMSRAAAPPPMRAPAIPALPPVSEWADARRLGARGDDRTDDTQALQRAIDTHRVVYLPTGRYRVSDTLRLRPDSVLLGLHPSRTQILLPDGAPGFEGVGEPRPLLATADGGAAQVSGVGLSTGGANPRAVALLWTAGAASLVDDVKFQGGHGTDLGDGTRLDPYNAGHSADPDPKRRWDGQYPSLWVTRGGGGTFANIWSPSTYARAGVFVSNTSTPGHVYELSNEHHVRTEIGLDRVSHWEFLAPQTEEEWGESRDAASFEIRDSHDVLIANYHAYRVTRSVQPARAAVELYGDNDVRFRNVHVNAESGLGTCDEQGCATFLRASKFPYENAIVDRTHGGAEMREREFAALDVASASPPTGVSVSPGVETLASGFGSIAGASLAPDGVLYFVDRLKERIHSWSAARGLGVVRDDALDAVSTAVDRSGRLLVLSSAGRDGTVFSLDPHDASGALTVLKAAPAVPHPGATTLLPGNVWDNGEFEDQYDARTDRFTTLAEMFARDIGAPKALEYVSLDGSLVLPAFRVFQQGPSDFRGWRFSDTLDAYGLTAATPDAPVFLSNASEDVTYSGRVTTGGAVVELKPFATRGGESVAVDERGRVYVANGQVFVYDAQGRPLGRIDTPERPLQLVYAPGAGGALFILGHHSLAVAHLDGEPWRAREDR